MPRIAQTAASSTLLLPAGDRYGVSIHNDASDALYVNYGPGVTAASLTNYVVKIAPGGFYETPPNANVADSAVYGFWPSGTGGAAQVTSHG